MPGNNLVLYAKFTPPDHNIELQPGEGTVMNGSTSWQVPEGTLVGNLEIPTREGYRFLGWYTAATGGTRHDPSEPVMADKTYYAQWERIVLSYTVHYVDKDTGALIALDRKRADDAFSLGTEITEYAISVPGYRPLVNEQTMVLSAEHTEMFFYYVARQDVTYTVHYYIQGTTTRVALDKVSQAPAGTDRVTEFAPTNIQHTDGKIYYATTEVQSLELTGTADENVIVFEYLPYQSAQVEVRFWYDSKDGKGYVESPARSYQAEILIGGSVSASEFAAQDQYTQNGKYQFVSADPATLTVTEDMVAQPQTMDLYFDLHVAEYTIHHYLKDTAIPVAPDQVLSSNIGSMVNVLPVAGTGAYSTAQFYSFGGASVSSGGAYAGMTIREDASQNVAIVYYTLPLSLKANSATYTYDGTAKTVRAADGYEYTLTGALAGDEAAIRSAASVEYWLGNTQMAECINASAYKTIMVLNTAAIPTYYTVTTANGDLVIEKAEAPADLVVEGYTRVYDGTGRAVAVSGAMPGDVLQFSTTDIAEWSYINPAFVDVRTDWPVQVRATNPNYITREAIGYVTITPRDLYVYAEHTATYNGAPQTVFVTANDVKYGLASGHSFMLVGADLVGADAGTYTQIDPTGAGMDYDVYDAGNNPVTDNYRVVIEGKLVINQRAVTFTGQTAERMYNGNERVLTEITPAGLVPGHTYTGLSYRAAGTEAGTYPGAFTGEDTVQIWNGTVDVTANYLPAFQPGELTITHNEGQPPLTFAAKEKVYDGTPLFLDAATSVDETVTIHYYVAGNPDVKYDSIQEAALGQTDVGALSITAVATSENYDKVTEITRVATVRPRKVSLTSGDLTKMYDGNWHQNTNVTVGERGFAPGEGAAYHDFAKIRDAGRVQNTFQYTLNANTKESNYEITQYDGYLVITGVTPAITITADSLERTYNGQEWSTDGFTVSDPTLLVPGDVIRITTTGRITDVGMTENKVATITVLRGEDDVTKNYNFAPSVSGWLYVNPAPLVLTGNSNTVMYNGTLQTVDGFTAEGLVGTDHIMPKEQAARSANTLDHIAQGINAGEYPGQFVGNLVIHRGDDHTNNVAGNYTVSYVPGKLTITKSTEVPDFVVDDYDGVYDARVHSITVSGTIQGDTVYYSLDGETWTENPPFYADVTNGPITIHVRAVNPNYIDGTDSGTVTIRPRTIEASKESIFTYTGQEQGHTLTVATVKSITPPITNEYLTLNGYHGETEVGVYERELTSPADYTWSVAKTDLSGQPADSTGNYILKVTSKITIHPAVVTFTGETGTRNYNGQVQTLTGITWTGLQEGHTLQEGSLTYAASGRDVAGSPYPGKFSGMPVILDAAGNDVTDNYTIQLETGALTIIGAIPPLVIKTGSAEKTYDGESLTCQEFSLAQGTLLGGDVLHVTLNASQRNAGSTSNAIAAYWVESPDGKDVTINYSFGTPVLGALTVLKREVEVTSATDSKVYDGARLVNPTVTVTKGSFVPGDEPSYDVTGFRRTPGSSPNNFRYIFSSSATAANYTVTRIIGTLTVTPIVDEEIVITAVSDDKTYDGVPLTKHDYTWTGTLHAGDELREVTVTGSQTEAGSSPNEITGYRIYNTAGMDVTNAYNVRTVEGLLEVYSRGLLYIGKSDNVPYSPAGYTFDEFWLDEDYSLVPGHSLEEGRLTYRLTGTEVGGPYHGEFLGEAVIRDANGVDVTPNYTIETRPGNLTIYRVVSDVDLVVNRYNGVYDGKAHTITVDETTEVDGDTLSYSLDNATWTETLPTFTDATNAGPITVYVKAENPNYEPRYDEATVTIARLPISVGRHESYIYDDTDRQLYADAATDLESTLPEGEQLTLMLGMEIRASTAVSIGYGPVTQAEPEKEQKARIAKADGSDSTHNYTVTFDYLLRILDRPVHFVGESGMRAYTGEEIVLSGITPAAGKEETGLVPGHYLAEMTYAAKGVEVGDHPGEFAGKARIYNQVGEDVTLFYEITREEGTLTILPELKAEGYIGVYDGQVHSVIVTNTLPGDTVYYSMEGNWDATDWTTIVPTRINAADHYDYFYIKAENPDYITRYAQATIRISQRPVTIERADEFVYNGQVQTQTITQNDLVSGLVEGETLTMSRTYTAGPDVDVYEKTENLTWDDVFSGISVTKANGEDSTDNYRYTIKSTITITPRPVTLTGETATRVYTGEKQSITGITGEALLPGHTLDAASLTYAATGVEPDTYPGAFSGEAADAVIRDEKGTDVTENYTVSLAEGTLTILPELKAEGYEGVYDGAAHTITVIGAQDDTLQYSTDNVTWTDTLPTFTDVTTATVYVKAIDGSGFERTAQADVVITRRAIVIGRTERYTYDGTERTLRFDAADLSPETPLAAGDILQMTYYLKQTTPLGSHYDSAYPEAEDQSIAFLYKQDGKTSSKHNYSVTFDYHLLIDLRPVHLVGQSDTRTYTGQEIVLNGVTPEETTKERGLVKGHAIEGKPYEAKGVKAGEYPGHFGTVKIVDENGQDVTHYYTVTTENGQLTITAIATEIIITANSTEQVYNGKALVNRGVTYTQGVLAAGDFLVAEATGSQTDAGSSPNRVSPGWQVLNADGIDVTDSYTFGTPVDGTLTVTPRQVILTSATDEKPFDDTPLVNHEVTEGGKHGFLAGEGATYNVTGEQTFVGTSENTFTYTLKENTKAINYEIEQVYGTLTVTGDPILPSKTTPDVQSNYQLGDTIPFTITVRNVYAEALTDVTVTDATAILMDGEGYSLTGEHSAHIAAIAPGDTVTIHAGHVVTSEDILKGTVKNTATVTWENQTYTPEAETDEIESPDATLEVLKTSDVKDGETVTLGQTITYAITVENKGNVPFHNVVVEEQLADAQIQPGEGYTLDADGNAVIETLAVGETASITATYVVTSDDILRGEVHNTVTAKGDPIPDPKDPDDPKTPEDDGEETDETDDVDAALEVIKTSDANAPDVGDVITYTITVENKGNVPFHNVEVTDGLMDMEKLPFENGAGYTVDADGKAHIALLDVGEKVTLTVKYTVKEYNILDERVVNEAWADGDPIPDPKNPDEPKIPSDQDYVDDPTAPVRVDMPMTKVSDLQGANANLGQVVTYTITVENAGNVTYYNVVVHDEMAGVAFQPGDGYTINEDGDAVIETLPIGAVATLTAAYTVQQQDILTGTLHNVVTGAADVVTITDDGGDYYPVGRAECTDNLADVDTTLDMDKVTLGVLADGLYTRKAEYGVGDTIYWELNVTNKGNVDFTNVAVRDDLVDFYQVIGVLKVGETVTFIVSYTVDEQEILRGSVRNLATATGDDVPDPKDPDDPKTPSDTDETIDPTEPLDTTLTVEKTTLGVQDEGGAYLRKDKYELGDVIYYQITATNNGNMTYLNVTVQDERTGLTETIDKLEIGQTATFLTSLTVTGQDILLGSVVNVATAKGELPDPDHPEKPEGEDTEENPTEDVDNALLVEKLVLGVKTAEGYWNKQHGFELHDEVYFLIKVTNTGNVPYKNLHVVDPETGLSEIIPTLAVGETAELVTSFCVKVEHVLTGWIVNHVTVKGEFDGEVDPDRPMPDGPEGKDEVHAPTEPEDYVVPLGSMVMNVGDCFE